MTELTIDHALQKGVEAHKAGQIQEADRLYTAILKAQPKHPDANHNMGVLAVGVGKVEQALPFFKTALEANPATAQFWLSYIDALIKLNKLHDAQAVLDQAKSKGAKGDGFDKLEQRLKGLAGRPGEKASKVQDAPKDELQSLMTLYNRGQLALVVEHAQALTKQYPEACAVWNLMGASAARIGQLDQAIFAFKRVLAIKPNFAEAYYNMGKALKDQSKLKEAIEAYNKAIDIKPDYAEAYNNMGKALKEQGKLEEAIEAYNKALAIKPGYAEAYNNIGISLKDQGKLKEAIEAYNKAIAIKPDYAGVYSNMGATLQEQGKLKEAIEAYNKALAINPDNAGASINTAILLYNNGKYEKAAQLFFKDESIKSQSYLLKCLYELGEQSKFYTKLDYLVERGESNCVIGSFTSRAEIRYGIKRHNPFCNDPLKYVLKTDLTKEFDFKKIFVENAANVLSNDEVKHKSQDHLTNGIQTAGNIFTQVGSVTSLWQDIIHSELKKYRDHFCKSEEGLMKRWPSDYSIYGWLVSMKSGGELSAHIHDTGWITGSIYINVPPKSKKDSGNLVVTTHDSKHGKGKTKDIKSIDVVTGSLCLFPSSLLHYTIPFESDHDRIVLAFDIIPNK